MTVREIDIKIKELARKNQITLKELAEKIGITEQGLYTTFKNESLKVTTLLKISEVLNVDINEFFRGDGANDAFSIMILQNTLKDLSINFVLAIKEAKQYLKEKDIIRYEQAIKNAMDISVMSNEEFAQLFESRMQIIKKINDYTNLNKNDIED